MRDFKYIVFTVLLFIVFSGCQDLSKQKTTLEVLDNNRHYYPVLRGDQLEIVYTIKNTGKNPFMLTDLIISCGCIAPQTTSIYSIPSGKEGRLVLIYDSSKNIGFVKHYIELYGNLEGKEKIELVFDTNIVPPSDYTKDYEEVYVERKGKPEENEDKKKYYLDSRP